MLIEALDGDAAAPEEASLVLLLQDGGERRLGRLSSPARGRRGGRLLAVARGGGAGRHAALAGSAGDNPRPVGVGDRCAGVIPCYAKRATGLLDASVFYYKLSA
jgi:hypothetical protein